MGTSAQVFQGVKIADFGWIVVEPLTIKYLADHGAEVIRIESRSRLDATRAMGPYKDNIPGIDRAPFYATMNSNKYGVMLNLKHPKAVDVVRRIVAWADIVGEGYVPGTMSRLGFGYQEIKKINPDIIMLSTSNMGQTGPYASCRGFGTQLAAYSGFASITGWSDREPNLPYGAYTDAIAPLFGAIALVAALDYRRRTGKGQYIDLSQYEASIHFLSPLVLDFTANGRTAPRMGNRCTYAAPHGAYPCRGENRWCVIGVFTDDDWQAFREAIGDPAWSCEPRFATLLARKQNEDELDRLVGEWTKQHTAEEVMSVMQGAGIAAGVVQSAKDIYRDPQVLHRHHFWQLRHQGMGVHSYEAPAFRLSKTPCELRTAGPCLGEHNEFVYTQILGMSDEEFVQLLAEEVIS